MEKLTPTRAALLGLCVVCALALGATAGCGGGGGTGSSAAVQSAPPPPPPPVSGSAVLAWTAPTTNTDGTALTNLAGFTISYGTSPSAMTQTIDVPNSTATGYTVVGLTTGTWYFTVTAYTSGGTQSAPSDVASKTI